jgi:hypothetical protein
MWVPTATSLIDSVGSYAELLGTVLAVAIPVLGGLAWLLGIYRRTVGRRRERYERLGRLGTGGQLSFFTSVLGEPPAIRRTVEGQVTEFVGPEDPRFDPALAEGEEDEEPQHEVKVPRIFTVSYFVLKGGHL